MSSTSNLFRKITANLRNLFCTALFIKRNSDDSVQVKTHNGVTLRDKKESFFYGFYAKAKGGKALVFCQAGSCNDFEILPILKDDDVTPPELKEGDSALYTEKGGWVICRENGEVELFGKDFGGLIKVDELQDQLAKLTYRVDGIIDALKNSPTVPQDGGSSYKAGIVGMVSSLIQKEDFSKIASDKVFHGSGN